jgi:hypothetical protein
MQELMIKREATVKNLNECITYFGKVGRNFAKARCEYTIAWQQEAFRLNTEAGIARSSCNELAKGNKEVANLRFLKDVRESDRNVCYEKILVLKFELRLIEGDMLAERQGV